MPSFSERQGIVGQKPVQHRDELPLELKVPIYEILRSKIPRKFFLERVTALLNPYGIDEIPYYRGDLSVAKDEDNQDLITLKRIILGCSWLQIYEIVEDAFAQLLFYEEELANMEDEVPRANPLQEEINRYFLHAGIGWKMVKGKIVYRGDEPFEQTVQTASKNLLPTRPTAARRLQNALESLSKRPAPDTAGAVSDAVSAIECVLSDIEGVEPSSKSSLTDYISRQEFFPGSLKAAVGGLWGYACNQGARHGKEGVEPTFAQAQFVVSVCSAISALLNAENPKS